MKPPLRPRGEDKPRLALCSVLLVLCSALLTPAIQAQRSEHAVRAAFVYNLTKFVVWPHTRAEIVIGYIGDHEMGQALTMTMAGKKVENKSIRVVQSPAPTEWKRCDLIYVADASPAQIHALLGELKNTPVLTVGNSDQFVRDGGMIGLVRIGDQIQIEANPQVAVASGLQISSRLLGIAIIVRPGK